ncbi:MULTISPECIES: phage tail protein [unclassified Providencia]|nr:MULTISPECIES: phage tail protein [unclassified Providencia]QIF58531.1 tail fiber protein [Providencia sp. 1701011]QIF62560.1 tail fiber protein [Providencia sp. 1701091]
MKNPKLIVKPFAKNGQKNVIPENYETSMDSNQATWDQGFGQITMLPVAAGGLPPKGQDFNGILNQISENIVYQSQGGRFKFSPEYAESIGGYPKGAILQSDDEKKEYQSSIDNNKVNFNTATQTQVNAAWKLISTDDMLQQIAGKQPSGSYAIKGDSYTKIESDGRYQPKGNYAPAGDYATNVALTNGLDKKFNKTGGSISGNVTVEGDVASKYNGYIVKLETRGGKTGIVSSTDNQMYYTHTLQEKSGTLMHLGDGGWMSDTGAVFGGISLLSDYRLNSIGYAYSASQTDTYHKTNHHFLNVFGYVNRNYGVQLAFTNDGRVGFRNIENNTTKEWADFYTTINTTIDRNGCLKVAGTSNELSDFPVGSPIPWPQATAPTGFLVCNGQTFNKTTYPLLAVAYPSGKLPDLRSEFIRGLDAGRNVDSGRTVLSAQSDAMQNITGEIGWGENGLFTIANGVFTPTQSTTNRIASAGDAGTSVSRAKFEASNQARTANENRPRNIAFLYIVRAA